MPFPLVRPITNIADCIHNSSTPKNQDEFFASSGGNSMFLLKNSVEKIYGPSGTGNMPPDRRCLPNRGGRNDQPASFASRSWGKRRCEPFFRDALHPHRYGLLGYGEPERIIGTIHLVLDRTGGGNIRGRKQPLEKIAVLSWRKSPPRKELEEFSFFPGFSLTAPRGHHILYA